MSSDSSTETDGYRWGSLESFNGKVFITAAIIFFLVLAGYLALQCLNRYIFAGHAMDGLLRQLGSVQLQPANHQTDDQLPISTTRTGLHPSVIAALPVVAYQKGKKNDDNTYSDGPVECAVCLGQLEEGEKVRTLPRCLHLFHVGCIDMWLFSHSTCPVCRANAEPPDDPLRFPDLQVVAMARLATAKELGSTSRQRSSIDASQDLERSQC